MVIAGWGEGKLYGFDFQAGGVVWEDSLEGDIVSSPGAGANALYVGTTAGKFYAYDITTSGSIGYAPRLRTTPSVRITGRFIRVFSPNASRLSATIFDAAGRRVYHIEKSLAAKGSFTGAWSDGLIAHGIYFADVRLRSIHGETHRRISRLMRMQ
jgi:outer membrane protein assembly factor BamB